MAGLTTYGSIIAVRFAMCSNVAPLPVAQHVHPADITARVVRGTMRARTARRAAPA
jgi:hypothetical protein